MIIISFIQMDLTLHDQLNFPTVLDLFQSNMIENELNFHIENKLKEYLDCFLKECELNPDITYTNSEFLGSLVNSGSLREIETLFGSFEYELAATFSNVVTNYNLNVELTVKILFT